MYGLTLLASLAVFGARQGTPTTQPPTVIQTPVTTPQPLTVVTPATTTFLNARMDEPLTLGTLRYRVASISEGLKEYMQKYDQRETRLTPGFKNDRLVVVEVEAENPTDFPGSPQFASPALVDEEGNMTDRATWDIRQKSYVRSSRAEDNPPSYITTAMGGSSDPVLVAPHGKVRFALIFSQPASAKASRLQLSTNASGFGGAGMVGTVTLTRG